MAPGSSLLELPGSNMPSKRNSAFRNPLSNMSQGFLDLVDENQAQVTGFQLGECSVDG